jgi:hypothetical protein
MKTNLYLPPLPCYTFVVGEMCAQNFQFLDTMEFDGTHLELFINFSENVHKISFVRSNLVSVYLVRVAVAMCAPAVPQIERCSVD